jgi:SAM-dependent methyltransferase
LKNKILLPGIGCVLLPVNTEGIEKGCNPWPDFPYLMDMNLFQRIWKPNRGPAFKEPEAAYDLWANSYDDPGLNLVLDMDTDIVEQLLRGMDLKGKRCADIGCGTGRHWPRLWKSAPLELRGYDVSEGMLARLVEKFPQAQVRKIQEDGLAPLEKGSLDLLMSTLALAHVAQIEPVFRLWAEALAPGGCLILTDFHPLALNKGAKRTFSHNGQPIAVKSYVHPLDGIRALLAEMGLTELRLLERVVDQSVRSYYSNQSALPVYEKYLGVPMVYGLLCRKQ